MRQIDLPPENYSTTFRGEAKKREPILGSGWRPALAWLISFTAVVTAVHYLR